MRIGKTRTKIWC